MNMKIIYAIFGPIALVAGYLTQGHFDLVGKLLRLIG